MKGTGTILRALAAHSPFSLDTNNNLRNILNGVNADSNVNPDTAKSVGEKILLSINGMLAPIYSFKLSAQEVTMALKSSVKIADDRVQVDPQLLFQRLVIACDNFQLEELFLYKLCTYPIALFDSPFMLRQPQKSALTDALWPPDKADTRGQDAT